MTAPKLSLSRMESQLAKVSRESTTVQKDEWEQFLSWAKRARPFLEELQRIFDKQGRQVSELQKLLSECGE